ncbi:MAG: hypothetical protein ACR2RB_21350 [Gammaproteobacteria bacterium]
MATEYAFGYLEARGISSPQALNAALERVLEAIEPMVYEDPTSGLTKEEQAVLREGGLRLERTSGRDLVAEGAVRFAALVERSLSAEELARQLKVTPGRVYQLMADRELYSFRLEGKRLVPDFQIREGKLIPNIGEVNKVLPKTMHPLGIFNWYHLPNPDLFIDDQMDKLVSPLDWLAMGRDVELVKTLASNQ